MIKLSDYIMQKIAALGVKHIFLLPGGGCMHLLDSVGRCRELEYVCNLHEQACAIAAEAYAQFNNDLGVALVTTGPGGTNTITGLAAAWLDSTPCLFISGQVKRADMIGDRGVRQMGFQEINIVPVVTPITKYAVTVTEPQSIRYHLEKAIYLAQHGRPGPVWLDVPLDVQAAEIDPEVLPSFQPHEHESSQPQESLSRQVNDAIQLLNQSERPIILVGNGVRLAGARKDFLQLIEMLNIPVLTTWKAMDFLPESHPLFAGRPGMVGQRGANFAQQNSDWLLTVGARLDLGQTGYDHRNFARAAKKVVVDVDAAEIGKLSMPIEAPICADAGDFLAEFRRQLGQVVPKDRSNWLARCREWKSRYPVVLPEYWQETEGVNNYVLVDVLADEMADKDLLIPASSGASSEVTMQAFRAKGNLRIFNAPGLGSMGFGIPASMGGCLASGGRRTVCLEGDGGFFMNIHELETVRRLGLPIKFFVLNNQGYGSIRATQNNYFAGRLVASSPDSGLTLPDIRKVGQAFGIATFLITDHLQIRERVREVLQFAGPAVCEVAMSPNQVTAPRLVSAMRPDATMVTKPLEDLWPFMEREEFLANMIIPPLPE
jgi:acetolactate synthase-1/2/3 large subunit